jgi:hypothetical protein
MRYMRYMRCALVMGYGVTWVMGTSTRVLPFDCRGCCPSGMPSRVSSRMPWVSLEVYDGYDG